VAKARKKSSARKPASAKKTGAKKKSARKKASSKTLNLNKLKKQIRDHVKMLSAARSADPRVGDALASLQRVHQELASACGNTMVIPLA
jgi:hypothetical protein